MQSIMEQFIEFNQAYYNGRPLLSDEEYDKFVAENCLGEYPSNYGVEVRGKVQLPTPIHGMDKMQKENEYSNFMSGHNNEVIVSEKLDGIALLFDLRGDLIHVYTRGSVSESTGQLVDWILEANLAFPIKELHSIQKLDFFVRGELIVSKENFKKISAETGIENPLSFISGYVNAKERNEKYLNLLDFRAFEIYKPDVLEQETPLKQFELLETFGLVTPNYKVFDSLEFDNLVEVLKTFKIESKFVIDGIIIAKNEKYVRELDRNPKHAKAFKHINRQTAKVIDIRWNVSAYKKLTPVISIETVKIEGKNYSSITGKTSKEVIEGKIGPGSEIVIGINVVPVMYSVLIPTETKLPNEEFEYDGVHAYLKHDNDQVRVKRIEKFFVAIGAAGFKEGSSSKFVKNGLKTILDITKSDMDEFVEIFGNVQGKKMYNEMFNKICDASEAQYMNSTVFFPGIAEKTFTEILKKLTVAELRNLAEGSIVEKPDGVGNVKWRDFKNGLKDYFSWKDEIGFIDKDQIEEIEEEDEDDEVEKIYFVLSGRPPRFTKADFIKSLPSNYIEVGSMTKADILIQNKNSTSTKTRDAEKRGVKIFNYEDFMKV